MPMEGFSHIAIYVVVISTIIHVSCFTTFITEIKSMIFNCADTTKLVPSFLVTHLSFMNSLNGASPVPGLSQDMLNNMVASGWTCRHK